MSNFPIECSIFPDSDNENAKPLEISRATKPTMLPTPIKLSSKVSQDLEKLTLHVRYDIMEQTSLIIAELTAVDAKYSALATPCLTKKPFRKSSMKPIDTRGGEGSGEQSALENFHAVTLRELHSQLGSVRAYIRELDQKYSGIARNLQDQVQQLEYRNAAMTAEIDRIRRFY